MPPSGSSAVDIAAAAGSSAADDAALGIAAGAGSGSTIDFAAVAGGDSAGSRAERQGGRPIGRVDSMPRRFKPRRIIAHDEPERVLAVSPNLMPAE